MALAMTLSMVVVAVGTLIALTTTQMDLFWYFAGWLVCNLSVPFIVAIAGHLARPFERRVHEGFKRQARAKLSSIPHLRVIGITGSYGKTSVKFILAEILKHNFSVLATPASYNTPMGICKVINNDLRFGHHILILEMGARYPGDIQELCAIVPPDISMLTSIGVAHLETMGSVENILATKTEIVRHMKPTGTVILNGDDARLAAVAGSMERRVVTVSAGHKKADLMARDISYDRNGTSFEVLTAGGKPARIETKLLGMHNVTNLLLAMAAGRLFDVGLRQMAHAIRHIEPVEHRLQLRQLGDITVIDDSFNSNPIGARSAIDIVAGFSGGRRVVVTPGMVELGAIQESENRDFGTYMAGRIDLAILIGTEQTHPIREGLESAGHPKSGIRQFESFFDAQDFLKTYLKAGDVVLYENDLPDQYGIPGAKRNRDK
jgi:UDP-N-acetylmuramoyl-tripeptide--D-alanyl-D-alanine ligase